MKIKLEKINKTNKTQLKCYKFCRNPKKFLDRERNIYIFLYKHISTILKLEKYRNDFTDCL